MADSVKRDTAAPILILVWGLLILSTLVSWLVQDQAASTGSAVATSAIWAGAALAGLKILLIVGFFMELRASSNTVRLLATAWVLLLCSLIALMDKIGPILDLSLAVAVTQR